jgi:hypothetical protein
LGPEYGIICRFTGNQAVCVWTRTAARKKFSYPFFLKGCRFSNITYLEAEKLCKLFKTLCPPLGLGRNPLFMRSPCIRRSTLNHCHLSRWNAFCIFLFLGL